MMDYQVFRTRALAQAEASEMRGWDNVRVVRVYHPEHPMALHSGYVWVIAVGDQYLRTDGFVR